MLPALSVATLALAGLMGLFILRLSWTRRESTAHYTVFPILFGVWIVSVVVWNTYFFAYKPPGFFDISVERCVFVLLAVCAAYQIFVKRVRLEGNHTIELLMLAFLAVCVLSMTINGFAAKYPRAPKPWYVFFTGYLAPFMAFCYARYFLEDLRSVRVLMTVLFALGVYLCVVAILERYQLRSLVFPSYITNEAIPLHLDRSRGPLLNAAFNGLAMTVCFVAGLFLLAIVGPAGRFLVLSLMPLFFVGVFFTATRSAYLVFLLAVGSAFFCRTRAPKWKLLPLILAVCLLGIVASSERLLSTSRQSGGIAQMAEVEIRFQLIAKSLRLFQENPLLGVGLAHFAVSDSPETFQDNQHNHLIGMAVELGVIGVAAYLGILVLIFRALYGLARDPRVERNGWANAVILITLGLTAPLVNNVFVEASLCPFINVATFTFAGLACRLSEHPETLDGLS